METGATFDDLDNVAGKMPAQTSECAARGVSGCKRDRDMLRQSKCGPNSSMPPRV